MSLYYCISEITVGGDWTIPFNFSTFISKPQLIYSNQHEYKHIENAGKSYVYFALLIFHSLNRIFIACNCCCEFRVEVQFTIRNGIIVRLEIKSELQDCISGKVNWNAYKYASVVVILVGMYESIGIMYVCLCIVGSHWTKNSDLFIHIHVWCVCKREWIFNKRRIKVQYCKQDKTKRKKATAGCDKIHFVFHLLYWLCRGKNYDSIEYFWTFSGQ